MRHRQQPVTPRKIHQILSAARHLFWKHGVKRVSVEEICQTAAVSKMTFYRFFPNKIELAKAVFEREVDLGLQRFREILNDQTSPAEKIRNIVALKLDGTHDISPDFLNDFYGSEETGLKQYVDQKSSAAWNEMLTDFKAAQKRGVFREDLCAEFLLLLSQKLSGMVTDEKVQQLYKSPQDLLAELTNFVAYGISPRGVQLKNAKPGSKRKD